MDNFLAILAVGGFGAVAGMIGALFSSETFRTEGPVGFLRWMHWKLSTTERQRHPYLY